MDIYHYDDSGVYRGTTKARPDPKEIGRWLVPRNATTVEPPATGENETAVYNGAAWSVVEDHRGEVVYNEDNRDGYTMTGIGPIPDGFVTVPPATDFDELIGGQWVTDTTALEEHNAKVARQEVIEQARETEGLAEITLEQANAYMESMLDTSGMSLDDYDAAVTAINNIIDLASARTVIRNLAIANRALLVEVYQHLNKNREVHLREIPYILE